MATHVRIPAIALFSVLAAVLASPPARAQVNAPACGMRLTPPVLAKWNELGGATGALGCPNADETPGSVSPQGSKANEADFASGMILWHATGPRAGQTYAITGCIWRLYFQYSGPSGWLGLPIGDAVNFPDGQHQKFEGGRITYLRAPNACEAERASELAVAAPAPAETIPAVAMSPLDAYFDPTRGDHLSTASASVAKTAQDARYQRVGPQARVLDGGGPGTTALKLFWNDAKGDHLATATAEGQRDAFSNGYQFEASQGFVWIDPRPTAVALEQYIDPVSGHHWLVAGPEEEARAKTAGFQFVRVEGYAPLP